MTMTRHAVANHLSIQKVESGEEGGGAMAFVNMGESAASARLHRQSGLGLGSVGVWGQKYSGRVAQIDLRWKEKRTQAGGDVLTECSPS